MWIELTKKDGRSVLVNMAWIAEALPSVEGSVLLFDRALGDDKKLAVEETIDEIAEALGSMRSGRAGWRDG